MHLETSCYLGPTLNPFSLENTPGGSSGGEGALVALHGSAAGVRLASTSLRWRLKRRLTYSAGGSVRSGATSVGAYDVVRKTECVPDIVLMTCSPLTAAAYCGLWTLKPTTTRFPIAGSRGTMLGTELMTGVVGPMTRSFRAWRACSSLVRFC
jgi:amidase